MFWSLVIMPIDVGILLGALTLGRPSDMIIPSIILVMLFPFLIRVPQLSSVFGEMKSLGDAMLAMDMGVYVTASSHRKRLHIRSKYLPFNEIKTIYSNRTSAMVGIRAKNGATIRNPRRFMPDIGQIKKRWGDRIQFIEDRCWVRHGLGSKVGEFIIVDQVDITADRAILQTSQGEMEEPFFGITAIQLSETTLDEAYLVIERKGAPKRRFIAFNGTEFRKIKKTWTRFRWKTQ